VVNAISIAAIFIIITLVEGSFSLPFVLIAVIELAIFINLGLPHVLGQSLPFIAPICISTIQLGATVDYAILMTTRYKAERLNGEDKKKAVMTALPVAASTPNANTSASTRSKTACACSRASCPFSKKNRSKQVKG
jgi:predicted RND superfamily exporter protein